MLDSRQKRPVQCLAERLRRARNNYLDKVGMKLLSLHTSVKVGGQEGQGWLNQGRPKKGVKMAGGGGGVALSAAFWEKVTDRYEERETEEKIRDKARLSRARKIQSSAAFWEQIAENNGCKWEGGEPEVGDKTWEKGGKKWEEYGKKLGRVKCWEVRNGFLEERRKHWAEGEHQTIDHNIAKSCL